MQAGQEVRGLISMTFGKLSGLIINFRNTGSNAAPQPCSLGRNRGSECVRISIPTWLPRSCVDGQLRRHSECPHVRRKARLEQGVHAAGRWGLLLETELE